MCSFPHRSRRVPSILAVVPRTPSRPLHVILSSYSAHCFCELRRSPAHDHDDHGDDCGDDCGDDDGDDEDDGDGDDEDDGDGDDDDDDDADGDDNEDS